MRAQPSTAAAFRAPRANLSRAGCEPPTESATARRTMAATPTPPVSRPSTHITVVWAAASTGPIQSRWATSQKPTIPSATMPSARAMARILSPGRAHRPDTIPPMLRFGVAGSILVEAWHRVRLPAPVLAGPMAAVAALGLAVNLVAAWLLHRGAAESLTVRAAYLEVLGDALSSVAALVAAGIMVSTGWTGADPLASALIVLLILPRTWSLLRQAVNVLLEGTPAHLSLGEIEAAITRVTGVRRVHDLHVWTLTSGREAMSAHVVVDDVRESERLLGALHAALHAHFGIDHTTIQLETEPPAVLRIKSPTS